MNENFQYYGTGTALFVGLFSKAYITQSGEPKHGADPEPVTINSVIVQNTLVAPQGATPGNISASDGQIAASNNYMRFTKPGTTTITIDGLDVTCTLTIDSNLIPTLDKECGTKLLAAGCPYADIHTNCTKYGIKECHIGGY